MNPSGLNALWVYLSATPLLWLSVTLLAYIAAHTLHRRLRSNSLANPVLVAVALLVGILLLTNTSYTQYFEGAQFVHFLLGPTTVALAVPLYAQLPRVRVMAVPILVAMTVGSFAAVLTAWLVADLLGASLPTLKSLAPKSVTTPIAMGISERIGGLPSLAAALVILTGIIGGVMASGLFRLLRLRNEAAQGFALGLAAHGVGTARAFQMSEKAGAFSALAMGVNGLFTALTLPWLVPIMENWLYG